MKLFVNILLIWFCLIYLFLIKDCRPYQIGIFPVKTPKCKNYYIDQYHTPYQPDKKYALRVYSLLNNADYIRKEIFEAGPVVGTFEIYENFQTHTGNVSSFFFPFCDCNRFSRIRCL